MVLKQKRDIKQQYFWGIAILFIIVFQFQFEPKLAYHKQQPLFLFDFNVLIESFSKPGGFISYISQFFTELYFYPLLGSIAAALLISVLSGLIYHKVKKTSTATKAFYSSLIIWVISAILFFNYSFKIEAYLLIIGALLFSNLAITINQRFNSVLILLCSYLPLSILAYITLGGLGLFLTTLLVFIYILYLNLIKISKIKLIAPISALVLVIPFLFVKTIFQIVPLKESYLSGFLFDTLLPLPTFYYVVLFIMILMVLYAAMNKSEKPVNDKHNLIAFILGSIMIILLPIIYLNNTEKKLIEIDYLAYNKQWDKLLNKVDSDILNDQIAAFNTNRALFFTGQLLEDGCRVPQKHGINGLFLNPENIISMMMPTSDLYYDLGLINESRHWAHEAYTIYNKQPRILKRLTQVNIINEKYNTAKKYTTLLKKSMVNRSWALEYEKILTNELSIADFPDLFEKQNNLPTSDFFVEPSNQKANLLNLLNQPQKYPMAFEYLMAYYLFNHQIGDLHNNIQNFKKYNYSTLPKIVQQALTIYFVQTKQTSVNLSGYQIENIQLTQFKNYFKLHSSYLKGNEETKINLDNEYFDTYWYYVSFISPITLKNN